MWILQTSLDLPRILKAFSLCPKTSQRYYLLLEELENYESLIFESGVLLVQVFTSCYDLSHEKGEEPLPVLHHLKPGETNREKG